jgi:hypothetical protein
MQPDAGQRWRGRRKLECFALATSAERVGDSAGERYDQLLEQREQRRHAARVTCTGVRRNLAS